MIASGFLVLIPVEFFGKVKEIIRESDDVIIFRPDCFKDIYKDFFDECSVADASVDADGSLGQG